jgi:hypothetical protein
VKFDVLSNPDVWAIDCQVSDRDIKVGILALRSPAVVGKLSRLYAHAGSIYFDVEIPKNPVLYKEVLLLCQNP